MLPLFIGVLYLNFQNINKLEDALTKGRKATDDASSTTSSVRTKTKNIVDEPISVNVAAKASLEDLLNDSLQKLAGALSTDRIAELYSYATNNPEVSSEAGALAERIQEVELMSMNVNDLTVEYMKNSKSTRPREDSLDEFFPDLSNKDGAIKPDVTKGKLPIDYINYDYLQQFPFANLDNNL